MTGSGLISVAGGTAALVGAAGVAKGGVLVGACGVAGPGGEAEGSVNASGRAQSISTFVDSD